MDFAWKYVSAFDTACGNYVPYFDVEPVDHDTLLDCGSLVLTTGILGDYHIEWQLDSPTQDATTVFTSGITADPGEVQMQHPFSDPQPVQAGTLYPVFKYLYVNGTKFSAYEDELGASYSPDLLTCLGPYIVDPITCATTRGSDLLYPYTFSYNNLTDDADLKTRTFKIDLLAPTSCLAISFDGVDIAEELDIYYCTSVNPLGTLVDSIIHGITGVTTNYEPVGYPGVRGATIPRRIVRSGAYQPLRFVSDFRGFTWASGDFLLIVITGSVLNPSETNTNWTLKFKCIFDADISCTYLMDSGINKIVGTPTLDFLGDPSCTYGVNYSTVDTFTDPNVNLPGTPFLHKYFSYTNYTGGIGGSGSFSINPIRSYTWWKKTPVTSTIYGSGADTCVNLSPGETFDLDYVLGDIILSFSNVADYNIYVGYIAAIKATANYTTWLGLTDADSRYYATIRFFYRDANSCGDSKTDYYLYFWLGSTISYDAINYTITFTPIIPTNALPADDEACESIHASIDTEIARMTNTANNTGAWAIPGGGLSSGVRMQSTMYATWIYENTYYIPQTIVYYARGIENFLVENFCDLSIYGFCQGALTSYPTMWVLFRYWDRLTLTDTTNHASRLANWRFERKIGLRTDDCNDFGTTDWEIVYETP